MCFIVVRTRIGHSLRCLLNVHPMRDSISQWKEPGGNGPGRLSMSVYRDRDTGFQWERLL